MHQVICTRIYIAALFMIIPRQKQPKYPIKVCMDEYIVICAFNRITNNNKNKEPQPNEQTGINHATNIMVSERN